MDSACLEALTASLDSSPWEAPASSRSSLASPALRQASAVLFELLIRGALPADTLQQTGPRGNNGGNTRYTQHARNTPMGGVGIAPAPQMMQQQIPLASLLASAEPERQKQILGDHLYPLVTNLYPAAAGKLTGMLLQMDNSEILHLLEDPATLQQELNKANEVLMQHQHIAQ